MIVLDTNVVSETMKPNPDEAVLAWLDDQTAETLYLTSVSLAELLFGIAVLPGGKRKERLTAAANGLIELYEGRVLFFDTEAARRYATLAVAARRGGRGLSTPDGYIAAVAAANGFAIATGDTRPFEASGLQVVNPWAA
jgi:predicted nucleic acid-binding protein